MLTDKAIRAAQPRQKPYKVADERGLFLAIMPTGSKLWRWKFRFEGREQLLALGAYGDVSLADARAKRNEARRLLATGVNPATHRRLAKASRIAGPVDSFDAVAVEWLAKFGPNWSAGHADRIRRRLERDVFPWLGPRPIREIEAPEVLKCLQRIETRGAVETAHRAMQNCGQVFRFAVATGRATRDPTRDLIGALTPVKQIHHASITNPAEIGALLRALSAYRGSFVTACALKLAALTFVRPGELRRAEWSEFELDAAQWRIPAEKTKSRAIHVVPLARQAVAVLLQLHPLTGSGRYVFPGVRSLKRPMSENTVNAALRRLGYDKEQMTGHGFRSMASTLLNEQGWHRDAVERQLAHGERDKVRGAYNYAEHLPKRRRMMQGWADYLDALRENRKVVAGNFGRAA